MKPFRESILNASLNSEIIKIFTGTPEELVLEIQKSNPFIHVFDCSNHDLIKKFKNLDAFEFKFLFSQSDWVLISYIERMPELITIVEEIVQEHFLSKFVLIGQRKSVFAKSNSSSPLYFYSLPNVSYYLTQYGVFRAGELLPKWLIHGMTPNEKLAYQQDKAPWNSTTKRHRVNKPEIVNKILIYIALHTNKTISFNEIGVWVGIDNETAQRYIMLLIDFGLITCLTSFSSRQKYEYIKGFRVSFVDNYFLNFYKNNFAELPLRADVQELWKSWLLAEKLKIDAQIQKTNGYFFWQSHTRQHIDLIVEEESGKKEAFIFSWMTNRKPSIPPLFTRYYPDIPVKIISPSNYLSFLTP